MAFKQTHFVIEVLNYKPEGVGFALSEKDGWFVGQRRFAGLARARRFPTRQAAQEYIERRYDGDRYEFAIQELSEWIR